jgi:hypothetical protein
MNAPIFYYRLQEHLLYDEGMMTVEVKKFVQVRRTKRGAWIVPCGYDNGKERFVLDGEGKRFAYQDMDQAVASFKIRKWRQIGLLENKLIQAKAAFKGANTEGFEPAKPFYDDTLLVFQEC